MSILIVYISLGFLAVYERVREADLMVEPEGSLLFSVPDVVDAALVQFYPTTRDG